MGAPLPVFYFGSQASLDCLICDRPGAPLPPGLPTFRVLVEEVIALSEGFGQGKPLEGSI